MILSDTKTNPVSHFVAANEACHVFLGISSGICMVEAIRAPANPPIFCVKETRPLET